MKQHLIIASVLLALGTSAGAGPGPAEKPLTLSQYNEILNGLATLSDGYTALDKDGKQVKLQYRLGATRVPVSMNLTALRNLLKGLDDARIDLVRKYFGETPAPSQGTPEWEKFTQTDAYKRFTIEYSALLNSPPQGVEVKLAHIKIEDLKIGDDTNQNPISPLVLAQIEPILDH